MKKKLLAFFTILFMLFTVVPTPVTVNAAEQYGSTSYKPDLSSYKYDKTVKLKLKKGSDISSKVNKQIAKAYNNGKSKKITRIVIPKGSYVLKNSISMYGNVILDCTAGVTITSKMRSGNMVTIANTSYNTNKKKSSKYGKLKNMTILGGTWKGRTSNKSTLLRLSHCSNVVLDGCKFTGGGCKHQVELAAINKCKITHCTFTDMKVSTSKKSGEKCEALQFDAPCNTEVYKAVVLDGTPMKNVTVTNCHFKNVPRGVGSHSLLLGAYHTNMNISNNLFENVKEEAIVALGFYNTKIRDNTIKNCGAGILVQNFKKGASAVYNTIYDGAKKYKKPFKQNIKCTIENNTITTKKSSTVDESVGIKVYGLKLTKDTKPSRGSKDLIKKGDYRVSGVTVRNNDIKCYAAGIHLMGTMSSTVSNNSITGTSSKVKMSDGLFVEQNCSKVSLSNNTINNSGRYGILVQNDSSVSNIKGNNITKAKKDGIKIYHNSKVTGNIEMNTIANTQYGIFIHDNASASNIINNTITSCSQDGIKLYDNAKVTGIIAGNTIENSQYGIFIQKKSSVKSIQDNTITNTKTDSIKTYDKGNVTSNISRNTITNSSRRGISVQSTSNALKVDGNKVDRSAEYPMYVNTGNKYVVSIMNNHFISPNTNISCVQVTSGRANCSGNVCENGKYGISIESGASGNHIGNNTYINCLKDTRIK